MLPSHGRSRNNDGLRARRSRFDSKEGLVFLFSIAPIRTSGLTHLKDRYRGQFFLGVKWRVCQGGHTTHLRLVLVSRMVGKYLPFQGMVLN